MKQASEYTTTLYVFWYQDIHDFWVRDNDSPIEGCVLVASQEVTFKLPAFDPTDALVTQLEAEKRRLQVNTQAKLNQIDEKIQSLLALPAPVPSPSSPDELF